MWIGWRKSSDATLLYSSLPTGEGDVSEKAKTLSEDDSNNGNGAHSRDYVRVTDRRALLPWLLCCVLLALLAWETLKEKRCETPAWRGTDFVPARNAIRTKEIKFKSGLKFIDNETMIRTFDPHDPVYVGTPNEEIDRNWANIALPQEFWITREEAAGLPYSDLYLIEEYGLYQIE
ncbi:hypothetical protein NA57DRAFT_59416 [Rhizodiscina lignyota]|uniref:Uncharacterized protein n=1 Tax=Rhizodiscina lignyota TaxID=1504668 RepID=A0A9P4IB96_9PEZI|nr:hypothetical protein NA57DRAFT_59416 [Rhizodiscina lignyota]